MTDELNFDFNEINLDFLLSSPPKKEKCVYDICMPTQEFPLGSSSISGTRNKRKATMKRMELAKKINDTDVLLTKIQNLEKEKVQLEQQLVDFQKTANEIQKLYADEKAQHEKDQTELQILREKCDFLDSELTNNQFKYEQMQAQFDEEKKRPYSYDYIALKYIKVLCKYENNLHKSDLAIIEKIKQYCLDKKLKVSSSPPSPSHVSCNSPKKRKVRHANIMRQKQSTQCSLVSCTLEHKEYKEMHSQGSQCQVEMHEKSTQHISTMTTRGTTTRAFIMQHDVGTCFPEPKKSPSVEAILKEISQWNVKRISPIKDLPTEASIMEIKTHRTVGTCTWLCNVRRKIDFLPKKLTQPAQRQCSHNIKLEIETPVSSPIPKQTPSKPIEQSISSQTNLSGKCIENSNVLSTEIFEDLWKIFGKMVCGLLQHNNIGTMSYPNNFHDVNLQHFCDWFKQLCNNTRLNENDERPNYLKNQVLNRSKEKSPLISEGNAPNKAIAKENDKLTVASSPIHFLEFPQLDCESVVKPEPRRAIQTDINPPLPSTASNVINTQIMIPPLIPNGNENVENKIPNNFVKKIKKKRKMKKGKKTDACKRHLKVLKESLGDSKLNGVDFLASLHVFHTKPSNEGFYASMNSTNEKRQIINKREAFKELFGESGDDECSNKTTNQPIINRDNSNHQFNQSTLNRNDLKVNSEVLATNNRTLSPSPILDFESITNEIISYMNVNNSLLNISPIGDLILPEQEISKEPESNEMRIANVKEDRVLRNIVNSKDSETECKQNGYLIENVERNESAKSSNCTVEKGLNDNYTNSNFRNDLEISGAKDQKENGYLNSSLMNTTINEEKINDCHLLQNQMDTSCHLNSGTLEACTNEQCEIEDEWEELIIDEEAVETFTDIETNVTELTECSAIQSDNNKTLNSTKKSDLLSSSLYEEIMTDSMIEIVNDLIQEPAHKNTSVQSPLLSTATSTAATVTIKNERKRSPEDGETLAISNKREKSDILNNIAFANIIGKYTNFTAHNENVELSPLRYSHQRNNSNKQYNDVSNASFAGYSAYNVSLEEQPNELNKQYDREVIKDSTSLTSYDIFETYNINNNEKKSGKMNSSGETIQNESSLYINTLIPTPTTSTLNAAFYDSSPLDEKLKNDDVLFIDGETCSNSMQKYPENTYLSDIDDSPQSPLQLGPPSSPTSTPDLSNTSCVKEPTIIPLEHILSNACFEMRTNKGEQSLIDELIDNYDISTFKTYYRTRYGTLHPDEEAVRQRIIDLLHDFCYTDNFSNGNVMASQLIKRIQEITTNYDHIYNGFVVIVNNAPPCDIPEQDLPSVIEERPPKHLTNALQRLDYVLKYFFYVKYDFCLNLMSYIERLLFTLDRTKHFTLTQCLHLTQLYLLACELQKNHFDKHPARLFIANCLYYYKIKAIIMIHEVLMWCPTVLPPREERTYNRSDVIITVIQHLLMNYKYDMNNPNLRGKSLLSKLRYQYHFEPFQPSQSDVITNLMEKLKNNKLQDLTYAFALICKRMMPDKTMSIILDQHLVPLAEQYFHFALIDDSYDTRIAALLRIIAVVVKPFPLQTNISGYLRIFSSYLDTIHRPIIQESAMHSILTLRRFDYTNCYKLLCHHKSTCEYSAYRNRTIDAVLKSFIYRKPKSFWLNVQLHKYT